ncbi:MAG: TRAP transporter large permease subunit [Deltaproteobacteria bacterium]|nr:TRAP transporter large permease subunit [Deltaproteobacteria bacterium]
MNITVLLLFIVLFFALIETPLFTVIAALSMVCLFSLEHDWLSLQIILIEMNRMASMPVLIALPLFTFVGCLLTETKAPERIMNFIQAIMGWLPGGLAIAALICCTIFTALTGASGVTIVALGGILYPVLRKQQYKEKFSLGLLTTSGSLGLLFPPSLPIIIYGVVSGIAILDIFKAAFLPGVLLIIVLSIYAFYHEFFSGAHTRQNFHIRSFSWGTVKTSFIAGMWDWPIIGIILIGVYGGFVTIAEVSAVVLVYVITVECFFLKEVHFTRQIPGIMVESAMLSGAILVILGVALGFTGYLVDEQIPNRILAYLTALTNNKYVFLAGLNLFLLAAGCIMDIFSALVIIVPIMVPVAVQYGIDPIHLCVIFLVNLEIGYSTPPVGINLFISSLKFQKPVTLLYRASLPYILLLLCLLILITYVPVLSLFFV